MHIIIIKYDNQRSVMILNPVAPWCVRTTDTRAVTWDLGYQGHAKGLLTRRHLTCNNNTHIHSPLGKTPDLSIQRVSCDRFRGSTRQTSSANRAAPLAISCHILQTFPCLLRPRDGSRPRAKNCSMKFFAAKTRLPCISLVPGTRPRNSIQLPLRIAKITLERYRR